MFIILYALFNDISSNNNRIFARTSIDTANEPYYVRVGSSDGKLGDYRYNVVIPPKEGEENSEPQKEQSKVFDTDEGSLAQAFREQGLLYQMMIQGLVNTLYGQLI